MLHKIQPGANKKSWFWPKKSISCQQKQDDAEKNFCSKKLLIFQRTSRHT